MRKAPLNTADMGPDLVDLGLQRMESRVGFASVPCTIEKYVKI